MTTRITREGCVTSHPEVLKKARADLRVVSTANFAEHVPQTVVRAYLQKAPNVFVVPMQWYNAHFCSSTKECIDERPPPLDASFEFKGMLKDALYQPEAASKTLDCLSTNGGGILSLSVGMGKTCVALYIAAALRAKTIVVVHKTFLADQWVQRAAQFVPAAKVTRVQANAFDLSGDIVVATIQTLVRRDHPDFCLFKLVIFDECHHVAAPMFSTAMFKLNNRYLLGLSATPTRKDGLEKLLHDFLGPIAYQKTRDLSGAHKPMVVPLSYVCDAYARPAPTTRFGTLDHTRVLNTIAEDSERTAAIVHLLTKKIPKDKNVLVLSHRRAHCEAIVANLPEAATYLGGDKRIPSSRVVVSTYTLVSEGFDLDRLDTLVLATPASDVEQAIGRILRGSGSGGKRMVYDIVDAWGPCRAQAAKRKKTYAKNGFVYLGSQQLSQPQQLTTSLFLPDDTTAL